MSSSAIQTHNPYALLDRDASQHSIISDQSLHYETNSTGEVAPSPSETSNFSNVYVSNLLPELGESWIRQEFSRFGLITSCKVMTKNGVSKGYGFVQFTDPQMAQAAVQALNGSYVGDQCISCKLADRDKDRGAQNQPSNNLYIGNLPTTWGVGEVSKLFGLYGPISSLVILSDPATGGSRGVSLVRYHTVEDSTSCIKALNGVVLEGHDRPLEVKYAETSSEKHQRKSEKKRNAMPKKAGNTRNRGRSNVDPRVGPSRPSNQTSTGNAGRSSSNSSASNGTVEVQSPLSILQSKTMRDSSSPGEGPSCPWDAPTPPPPAMSAPVHAPPYFLRPSPMAPLKTPPPALYQPPSIHVGQPGIRVAHPGVMHNGVGPASGWPLQRLPPRPSASGNSGTVLTVSGLLCSFDEVTLYKLFTPFGAVESVTIPRDPAGSGLAHVCFRSAKDAAHAAHHLHGAVMQDHAIQVDLH